MTTLGILFDKDGTLLDYYATWMPLNRKAALIVANGDQGLADHLLVAGGFDAVTGRMRSGSMLAAGNNAEIAALWRPLLGADAPNLTGHDPHDQRRVRKWRRCFRHAGHRSDRASFRV